MEKTSSCAKSFANRKPADHTPTQSGRYPVLGRMLRELRHQQQATTTTPSSEQSGSTNVSFAAFSNKLFGRDNELNELKEVFQYVSQSPGGQFSQLAMVHGRSGVGKSRLVETFVKQLPKDAFFASGKFDQLKTHAPFSALIKASNDLARQALQRDNSDEIRARIRSELGPQINLLGNIFQDLSGLADKKSSMTSSGQGFTSFKLLVRAFLRSIATEDAPVVLFMDDLQWADMETMEVLQGLLTDRLSKNIMLLFSYRDDEMRVEQLDEFLLVESDESSHRSVCQINVTDIALDNLDLMALNEMVSEVLHSDKEATKPLSNIIMNKTLGNPFYALNFMDMLCSAGMLTQNEDEAWIWDAAAIHQHTDVAENLVDILKSKVLRLPEKVRSILQIASFIGHEFSADILTTIVHEEQDMIEGEYSFDLFEREVIQQWIVNALEIALKEGLLEAATTNDGESFKFSHDRIQQYLYKDLIPDDVERRLLHQRIGKLIWQTMRSEQNDDDNWKVFLAADNLNRGPKFIDDDLDRREMIELNLRAARLAVEKAAYVVAVEYLRAGEKLVKDDSFAEANHDVCLELYAQEAEVERMVGCYSRSNELVRRVYKQAKVVEERFSAYMTEIKTLAIQGDLVGAMDLAFRVLRQVGVKFPKKITVLTVVKEFVGAILLIKQRSPEQLMELPLLTDAHKLFALELLSSISAIAFFAGETAKNTFVAVGLRMASLTVKHGLSSLYAPQAFAGYGFVCSFFGKYDVGVSFENLAMALLQKFESDAFEGRTKLLCFSFIHPWKFGIDDGLIDGFTRGYHQAMIAGDIYFGLWGGTGWMLAGFNGGMPLSDLVKKARVFCVEMEEYGARNHLIVNLPIWQMMLNILGDPKNPNPSLLSGEAMDLEDLMQEVIESGDQVALFTVVVAEATVACHFCDWPRLKTKMKTIRKVYNATEGYWNTPCSLATAAWGGYRLYKETGKRRYRREGRLYHGIVKKSARQGSPLSSALSSMATVAESLYVKKKSVVKVESTSLVAIEKLGENKVLWGQSVISEALAEAYADVRNVDKAAQYTRKAMVINKKWGAKAKNTRLLRLGEETSGTWNSAEHE